MDDERLRPTTRTPSEQVVSQRRRNRLIEYLELAASPLDQLEYERDAPIAHVPSELINQWEDNVGTGPRPDPALSRVCSAEEIQAIRQFDLIWDAVADDFGNHSRTVAELQETPEWRRLAEAAACTLVVFAQRGRLPEN